MTSSQLYETLRQMLAVLQAERQALSGLDLDAVMGAAIDKRALCGRLDTVAASEDGAYEIDEACRGMLDAAKRLNEANRQVRNLVAANVSARLEALTGAQPLYRVARAYANGGR